MKNFQILSGYACVPMEVIRKTWKCVLIRVETATKPIKKKPVLGCKLRKKFHCKTVFFNLG